MKYFEMTFFKMKKWTNRDPVVWLLSVAFIVSTHSMKQDENKLLITPETIGVKSSGDSFTIVCSIAERGIEVDELIKNSSDLSLEWLKVDPRTGVRSSVPSSGRVFSENGEIEVRLKFENFQKGDEGAYQCRGRIDNQFLIREITIPLTEIISYTNCPEVQSPVTGRDYGVKCEVESEFPYEIVWERENKILTVIHSRKYSFQNNNRVMIIPSYNKSIDDGKYEVYINVPKVGINEKRTIHLLGQTPPEIQRKHWQDQIAVNLGTQLAIECFADGFPSPEITWLRDGIELKNSDNVVIADNVLEFISISEYDLADYSCKATNYAGTDQVTVQIREPLSSGEETYNITLNNSGEEGVEAMEPVITRISSGGRIRIGTTMHLECDYIGDEPTQAYWIFGGSIIKTNWTSQSVGEKIEVTDHNSVMTESGEVGGAKFIQLLVRNFSFQDGGEYTCFVNNSIGEANHSTVAIPSLEPMMIGKSPDKTAALLGDDVELFCQVQMDPIVSWKWKFGKDQWLNGDSGKFATNVTQDGRQSTLTVFNVNQSDIGSYFCIAKNGLDFVASEIEIIEMAVPPKPSITLAPADGVSKVRIKNLPIFQNANPENVTVCYNRLPYVLRGDEWTNISFPWNSEGTYNLTHLKRNSKYHVKVTVENKAGSSIPSNTDYVVTIGSGFRKTMTAVQFDPENGAHCYDTKCELNWNPPEETESEISNYRIRWVEIGAGNEKILRTAKIRETPEKNETHLPPTTYIIDNLTPETKYNFSIAGINKDGEGPRVSGSFRTRSTEAVEKENEEYDKKEVAESESIRKEALILVAIMAVAIVLIFLCVSCYYVSFLGLAIPFTDRFGKKGKNLGEKGIEMEEAIPVHTEVPVRQTKTDEKLEKEATDELLEKTQQDDSDLKATDPNEKT